MATRVAAVQGEAAAAAHHGAVHQRHHGQRIRGQQRVQPVLDAEERLPRRRRHRLRHRQQPCDGAHIAAGAEDAARVGGGEQHDAGGGGWGEEGEEGGVEGGAHVEGEGVVGCGAVEDEVGEAVGVGVADDIGSGAGLDGVGWLVGRTIGEVLHELVRSLLSGGGAHLRC